MRTLKAAQLNRRSSVPALLLAAFLYSLSECASPAVGEVCENVVDDDAISMTTWKEDTLICVGSLMPGAALPQNISTFAWGCLKTYLNFGLKADG